MFSKRTSRSFVYGSFFALVGCLCARPVQAGPIFVTDDLTVSTDVRGNDYLVGKDNATDFNTVPGTPTLTIASGGRVTGSSTYDMTYIQGVSHYGIETYGSSTVNVLSGTYVEEIWSYDSSQINYLGGDHYHFQSQGTSNVTLQGGTVYNAVVSGSSIASISSSASILGNLQVMQNGALTVSGGNSKFITTAGTATTSVLGGTIVGLSAIITGTVTLYGGAVENLYSGNDAVVNLRGGSVSSAISLERNGIVNIYGSNLSYVLSGQGSSYTEYTLFGTLENGQSLDGTRLLDYDGDMSVADPTAGTGNLRFINAVAAAPEPGTIALLLTAGVPMAGLVRRRKKH